MSNEAVVAWGTMKSLETAGLPISNDSIGYASVASYDVLLDGAGFPDATFYLSCTFNTAPIENSTIVLCARVLGTDGEYGNAATPEPSRLGRIIGSFVVNDVTSLQNLDLEAYNLPRKADYYLLNNKTGQQIVTNWTLKVKPRTVKVNP